MAFGSSFSNAVTPPEDYDFLLLLNQYEINDLTLLKKVNGHLPVELVIDYLDQINRRGLENYQRGRHGSYFVACLASAKCLLGQNFYLSNFGKIPRSSIKRDLLYRIEEYFYRIQKYYVIGAHEDADAMRMIRKYLSRICMDLMLFSEELEFQDVHKYHYLDIINRLVMQAKSFAPELKEKLKKFFAEENQFNLIPEIIPQLYSLYLDYFEVNRKDNSQLPISRGRFGNLVFEYSLVNQLGPQNASATIVLLDGLPTLPQKKELIQELNKRGYDVFYPRYEGTWESAGEFLDKNPVVLIGQFIQELNGGLELNEKESGKIYKAQDIFIIGSSFGGGVTLSLPDQDYLKKICVVSPLISFKQVKGIETLEDYIATYYPGAYRFNTENWKLMLKDKLFCPLETTTIASRKILVIGGKLDNQISITNLTPYCKDKEIKLEVAETMGHISLSKIDSQMLDTIDSFLRHKSK